MNKWKRKGFLPNFSWLYCAASSFCAGERFENMMSNLHLLVSQQEPHIQPLLPLPFWTHGTAQTQMPGPTFTSLNKNLLARYQASAFEKASQRMITQRWVWKPLHPLSNLVSFVSQISQIHRLLLHFHCCWVGFSPLIYLDDRNSFLTHLFCFKSTLHTVTRFIFL